MGRPLPHAEIKIVGENSRIVAPGVPGELCTRGYCVMRGYWDARFIVPGFPAF